MENLLTAAAARIRLLREFKGCGLSAQKRNDPHAGSIQGVKGSGDYPHFTESFSPKARAARNKNPGGRPPGFHPQQGGRC